MDSWSKPRFRRNVSKTCLKMVENIKHLSSKKTEGKQLYFEFRRQVFGQFFIQDFCWSFLCFGGGFPYPGQRLLHVNLRYVRSMHILACLLPYTIIRRCRGPPRGFGEQGKRVFISGEQRPNFEGNRGTKTILGNREHKKTNFRFWGNRRSSQFISGEQGNRYPPPPPGRASML